MTAKHVTMPTQLARFPFVKSLDSFDFSYQPSIDRKQIQTLSMCRFVEHGENLVILGPPGVGKTHLAVGLVSRPSSAAAACFSPRPPFVPRSSV
jgi:DNA replication protein DnaC